MGVMNRASGRKEVRAVNEAMQITLLLVKAIMPFVALIIIVAMVCSVIRSTEVCSSELKVKVPFTELLWKWNKKNK